MKRTPLYASLAVIAMAAAIGCSNPADGKAEAEVSEAKPSSAPAASATTAFNVADGSSITWVGSKVTGTHDGGFNNFEGTITVADSMESLRGTITIDTTSIWSDANGLTEHLKTPDFFDVESHPTATFEITGVSTAGTGHEVTGNLTMKGISKSITFPATLSQSGDTISAQAEFVIKRFDWSIEYKGKADDLIRDEVVINFDLQATKAA